MDPRRASSLLRLVALLALSAGCGSPADPADDVDHAGRGVTAPDGGACGRCETALVHGGAAAPLCAPDLAALDALDGCACAGACAPRCGGLCGGEPVTGACVACVVEQCQPQYAACLDHR
jgi:hypothetical protein